jgi:2-keto-3-deoxy-L-rhamnonate aldolase RhmA
MTTAAEFKRKLRERAPVLGAWITFSDPACTEILSRAGFDFLLIDCEHAPISPETLRDLLIAGKGTATALLVRVAANDPVRVKLALDLGADGIMIPMVNSPDEARQAVAACKYPPEGIRSVGAWRASNYYQAEPEYLQRANAEITVIVQAEHTRAVQALDEILKIPGIDGVFIGPSDLAASLGRLGDTTHPEVAAAIRRIAEACRAAGVSCGIDSSTPANAKALLDIGANMLTTGIDTAFMAEGAANTAAGARQALGLA